MKTCKSRSRPCHSIRVRKALQQYFYRVKYGNIGTVGIKCNLSTFFLVSCWLVQHEYYRTTVLVLAKQGGIASSYVSSCLNFEYHFSLTCISRCVLTFGKLQSPLSNTRYLESTIEAPFLAARSPYLLNQCYTN